MADTVSNTSKANRIWTMFKDFETQRMDWAEGAANDEDFFNGRQWTDEEIREIKLKGMAPLVVNRTMPIILQEIAIFTSTRPSFRYFPRDDGDVETAAIWSDVASYIWHNSNGDSELQQTMRDYFVTGIGYMGVRVVSDSNFGDGEVMIESLPVWDVYPDPNSRKIDLSDARSIIVSRLIDEATLAFNYPDKKNAIRKAAAEEGSVMDRPYSNSSEGGPISHSDYQYSESYDGKNKVRYIECYEKFKKPMVRVMDLVKGTDQVVPPTAITDRSEWESSPDRNIMDVYVTRIRKTTTLGENLVLDTEELPISHYPIVPFFLHHNRNPYPTGDVAVIKGMQQEVNKRRSIMIHNATLAANYRMISQKGAIANKADYEAKGSTPGFMLEYHQGFDKPEGVMPQALPNAWIQLEGEAKGDMEYAVSVFSHMMGSSSDAPDTYRALLSLEEAGQRKVRHKAQHANHALRILGTVVWEYSRLLYDTPKILRVIGQDSDLKEVAVNGAKLVDGKITKVNDLTVGRYDLIVVDGTAMPTNRMALLNLYLEMYQLGLVDKQEVLKKTDIQNRDAVLERIGEVQQMTSQLQNAQEQMKDLEGLNQTLRRQLQQSMIKSEADTISLEMRKKSLEDQAKSKLMRLRMNDAVKNAVQSMGVDQQKANAQAITVAAAMKSQSKSKKSEE